MKAFLTIWFVIIFGWVITVTFFGPELYRAINGQALVQAK